MRTTPSGSFECIERLVWVLQPENIPIFDGCGQPFTVADVEQKAKLIAAEAERKRIDDERRAAEARRHQAILAALSKATDAGEIFRLLGEAAEVPARVSEAWDETGRGAWRKLIRSGVLKPSEREVVRIQGRNPVGGPMACVELSRCAAWAVGHSGATWFVDAEGTIWQPCDEPTFASTYEGRLFKKRVEPAELEAVEFVVPTGTRCEIETKRRESGSRDCWRWTLVGGSAVSTAPVGLAPLFRFASALQRRAPTSAVGHCPHCGAGIQATKMVIGTPVSCRTCRLHFQIFQDGTVSRDPIKTQSEATSPFGSQTLGEIDPRSFIRDT